MIARLAGLALVASLVGAPAPALAATTDPVHMDYLFPRGLPWAPTDSECYAYRCVWDAKHQGNGEGLSLILTRFHGDYVPKEITHRRAHRLQAAYCARRNVTCRGYTD
jgi:hypothetical protein